MDVNLRRHSRERAQGEYSLCWQDDRGAARSAQAQGADLSVSGIGLRCTVAIAAGSEVYVEQLGGSIKGYCTVRHCTARDGCNVLGLEFHSERTAAAGSARSDELDHYEFLQISPKAGQEVVHRVFRYMAARFHPDNPATGDLEKFLALKRAYDVLSDPERRARYDASRDHREVEPDPIFNMDGFVNGIEGEVNRRLAILALLYNKRRTSPGEPGISVWDLERRMALPREYLDFAIWYLKAKGYLTMADNSDLTLTASGVDYVEANADNNATLDKLLQASSRSVTDLGTDRENGRSPRGSYRLPQPKSNLEGEHQPS